MLEVFSKRNDSMILFQVLKREKSLVQGAGDINGNCMAWHGHLSPKR